MVRDPDSPGMRLRRFIEQTLRGSPQMTLPELLDAANEWARQGHTHKGYALWPGERPFGPHYLGLLLREDWAAKLGSQELRRQARIFRENPDKSLEDLAGESRERLAELRAREAEKREEKARKREEAKRAEAERERQAKAERERQAQEHKAEKERKRRKRHPKALGLIVEFFRAAGIQAAAEESSVRIGNAVINVSRTHVAKLEKLEALIDEAVWAHFREALLTSITRHLDGATDLRATPGTNGWVLSEDRTPLVVIRATAAKTKFMPAHSGNFLTRDADWAAVATEVAELRARMAARVAASRSQPRVFREFPDYLGAGLWELALDASRQLRTERNLVFGHAVELQYADGSIRFDPLRQGPLGVELPITWDRWTDGTTAEIYIDGRRDPLQLSFRGEDDDQTAVHGWVLALVGYAELVCREDLVDLLRPRPRRAPATQVRTPRSSGTRPLPGSRRARSSGGFKAVGRTRRWITSYVVGHRRRLRPGHRASAEAKAHAARVGITLRPGETWVSPHVRGVPPDAVLQFQWDAPLELHLDPR